MSTLVSHLPGVHGAPFTYIFKHIGIWSFAILTVVFRMYRGSLSTPARMLIHTVSYHPRVNFEFVSDMVSWSSSISLILSLPLLCPFLFYSTSIEPLGFFADSSSPYELVHFKTSVYSVFVFWL